MKCTTVNGGFFSYLHFLNDNLVPRSTKSNLTETEKVDSFEIQHNQLDGPSVYNLENPPSAKSKKKLKDAQLNNIEKIMENALSP